MVAPDECLVTVDRSTRELARALRTQTGVPMKSLIDTALMEYAQKLATVD